MMEKTYKPADIESRLYTHWEAQGYFKPSQQGSPYCIMIPPPNVTGSLHMGHGFNNSIMDTLIRYHRMLGHNTLWQMGMDHAGIATQMVVERQLAQQGLSRHDLGRDQFIDKVWEWKEKSGGTITRQIRRLGSSVDWSRERFTMDEGLSDAVKEAFVRLYDDGLIYRGKRLVNWDPDLHTAISDLEVENVDEQGKLWTFRYPLADGATTSEGKSYLSVATTRPETMLGDTAVAVHPEDERYRDLIGKFITLPLVNRKIPIIGDDYVDQEFGSGAVKITPAHDFNDYDIGKRHQLTLINIFDVDANILSQAQAFNLDGSEAEHTDTTIPANCSGLDRFTAREVVVADFEQLGLLEKIEAHALKVPRGDRSGVIIEPLLTDQWYVKASAMAETAMDVVANGQIKFVPKQYENMYFSWMRELQDWCISRQLWWGHRIPAWYDEQGNIYVGRSETEVREQHDLGDRSLRQDDDVLDTWFSSGLWTFSTLGWPQQTEELRAFHSTDVLVTGFDIIFFWVARMIMLTTHFMKNEDGTPQVPFKVVYVHGLVRDGEGQKMSKSKGNVLDPLDIVDGIDLDHLIEKRTTGLMRPQDAPKIAQKTQQEFPEGIASYGTDALRFTFCSLASTGRDIKFDMGRVEGFRNFCNKIWNAANYVLSNTEDQDCGQSGEDVTLTLADRWIITRLQTAEKAVTQSISQFRFDLASQAIYDFFWNEYCAWYLELTKPVLNDDDASAEVKRGTRRTLVRVLEAALRLAHPMMPFITEEIWQKIKPLAGVSGDTIMLQAFPQADDSKMDNAAVASIEWLQGVILAVRNIRGEMNIKPGKLLPVLLNQGSESDHQHLADTEQVLVKLARLESIRFLAKDETAPAAAMQLAGDLEVLVAMAGLIDKAAEQARLNKEIAKLNKEKQRLAGKLSNEKFIAKAPTQVVEKEQLKLRDAETALTRLAEQLNKLEVL